tara:strand:- start:75 stop:527 length:453 start_codon:yes stop_codon:yes gene_type:complete
MSSQIFSGSQGIVYIGSDAVASIRSFSLEETQETIDATTMSTTGANAFRTNKPTFKSWSGTVDVFWTVTPAGSNADGGAASAQAEFGASTRPGTTEATFHFWPSGDNSNELGYFGNGIITSRTISTSVDGMVEASFSVIGTTALATENGS